MGRWQRKNCEQGETIWINDIISEACTYNHELSTMLKEFTFFAPNKFADHNSSALNHFTLTQRNLN